MTDPLSLVPPYMRGKLNQRTAKYYQRHLNDLLHMREGSGEDMIDFLKEQGAFFYSIDEVLSDDMVTNCSLSDVSKRNGKQRTDWAEAFVRPKAPDYEVQLEQREDRVVKEFNVTETFMKTNDPVGSLDSEGQSIDTKKKIWAYDIFGRPLEEVMGTFAPGFP